MPADTKNLAAKHVEMMTKLLAPHKLVPDDARIKFVQTAPKDVLEADIARMQEAMDTATTVQY